MRVPSARSVINRTTLRRAGGVVAVVCAVVSTVRLILDIVHGEFRHVDGLSIFAVVLVLVIVVTVDLWERRRRSRQFR